MAPQARFARPTNRLAELERFYCGVLGFSKIGAFEGHDGFDGVMLAFPGADWHVEFTAEAATAAPACPSHEHLLVLYVAPSEFAQRSAHVRASGARIVPAHNPYWERHGALTVEDPDGYRVVLFPKEWTA